MAADMDRQMNVMMHRAELLSRMPQDDSLRSAVMHDLPPGTSFSMVSETSSNGVCTRVTRITRDAGDAKPQMVSQTSGDCGQSGAGALPSSNDANLKRINGNMPAAPAPRSAL
jgi:hypothetical protein